MDILDIFGHFYLNHLSPLWGYFFGVETGAEHPVPFLFHDIVAALTDWGEVEVADNSWNCSTGLEEGSGSSCTDPFSQKENENDFKIDLFVTFAFMFSAFFRGDWTRCMESTPF